MRSFGTIIITLTLLKSKIPYERRKEKMNKPEYDNISNHWMKLKTFYINIIIKGHRNFQETFKLNITEIQKNTGKFLIITRSL